MARAQQATLLRVPGSEQHRAPRALTVRGRRGKGWIRAFEQREDVAGTDDHQFVAQLLRLRYDNNASQLMRRSDHWPFLNRGVPAVWFHAGLHPDYHRPTDDAEGINYEKMEKIARLV
jgi:hypothetical protein